MIQIGINENVYLEKVGLDDKNVLELTFAEVSKEKPTSLFANIASDEVVENTSMGLKMFPPLPADKKDITEEKKVDLAVADINKTKGILRHILLGYLTSEDLKGLWAHAFDGLNITEESFPKQVQVKEVLAAIHKNLARIFMEKIQPFLNKKDQAFRLLLVRQSTTNHYAGFRGRYIEDNPFYESMEIPKEQSKLKFTPYEIQQGLTHGTPVAKEAAADKKGDGGAAPMTAANIFGT